MPASPQIWDLYDEWKSLTEKERSAILARNWREVRRCQRAKEQLQPRIISLTEALKTEKPAREPLEEINLRIRQHVNELIAMEMENSSILERCMAEAEKEKAGLEDTSSRLRKVHKSYGSAPAPVWNQYS
jgi:hypothetical protein